MRFELLSLMTDYRHNQIFDDDSYVEHMSEVSDLLHEELMDVTATVLAIAETNGAQYEASVTLGLIRAMTMELRSLIHDMGDDIPAVYAKVITELRKTSNELRDEVVKRDET